MHYAVTHTISEEPLKKRLKQLWNKEYPARIGFKSLDEFDEYLEKRENPKHTFVLDTDFQVQGWFFEFDRENQRWFGMILDSSIQKKGIGSYLLEQGKKNNTELIGWVVDNNSEKKLDGNDYNSPLAFYLKNGFKADAETRLETEKLSAVKIFWKKS